MMSVSEYIKPDIFSHLVVSGGNTMFKGFNQRLSLELSKLLHHSEQIKILGDSGPHQKYSVWIGGSIFASQSNFKDISISKEQYDEYGPSIVHSKCF